MNVSMTPYISIRNTSMIERRPTRHGQATQEKTIRESWPVKNEYDLANERHPDGLPHDELKALDRRRKQRERGKEAPLPKTAPWWDGIDQKRREVLSSPELLRGLLGAYLEAEGVTLEIALATMRRGRIPQEERELHDLLVRSVAALHERGAELTDIAAAIGKDRKSVEQLVTQGQDQRHGCKRHEVFQLDCPSCLRNAPDRAPVCSGPEALRGREVRDS